MLEKIYIYIYKVIEMDKVILVCANTFTFILGYCRNIPCNFVYGQF